MLAACAASRRVRASGLMAATLGGLGAAVGVGEGDASWPGGGGG